MKILSLGLDNSLLDKNSSLARRVIAYGDLVDKYTVIVPAAKDKEVILSDKVRVRGVNGVGKIGKLLKVFKLAKKLLRKESYDLITVQDQYYLAWLALRLARKFRIGLEIQVHGFEKLFGLRKIIAKFVIPQADAIRVVSQRLKKQLVDDFSVKEEKITVVPIYTDFGCRISDVGFRMSDKKSQDGKFIFLTVGRLVPVKNISLQIEAMAEVGKKYKNVELWIVGDGPLISDFRFQISDLKLDNKIKLFGWQDDLEKFYNQADVFLLTSNYEGWGMAIIEAASYGLPIIMTDVGCAGEVIKDGESGVVIPAGGQKELEVAMRKIIEDKDLRDKLGSNAKKAIEKLPSKGETLRLYKESWEKVCKNF